MYINYFYSFLPQTIKIAAYNFYILTMYIHSSYNSHSHIILCLTCCSVAQVRAQQDFRSAKIDQKSLCMKSNTFIYRFMQAHVVITVTGRKHKHMKMGAVIVILHHMHLGIGQEWLKEFLAITYRPNKNHTHLQ